MIKGFLVCFFILSCIQSFHSWALEDPKVSKHLMAAQEEQETNGSGNVNSHTSGDDEKLLTKDHPLVPKMVQKGKGSNGGSNVVHHPRPNEKSAAPILRSPSAFTSSKNFCISFSFILILHLLIA